MAAALALGATVIRRAALVLAGLALAPAAYAETHYMIVGGIGGLPEYEERFTEDVERLAEAARRTVADEDRVVVLSGEQATRDALRAQLEGLAGRLDAADAFVLFLVGHGSYDGEQYKFNLKGPDIDGAALGELLEAVPAQSQLVVNASSASGAVLESWAADDRIVITATRSGAERNATRFGAYWAEALSSDEADINKNGVVTVEEAFEFASRKVTDSYETEGALATEHPQLSGEMANRFEASRLAGRTAAAPEVEGLYDELTALEEELAALRLRRDDMEQGRYLDELQDLLVELATVQERIDAAEGE